MHWWLAYGLLGGFVGFFAGLLGIGGGMTIVPVLTLLFAAQQFPGAQVLHLALGTAMAYILFTSLSSLWAHHTHGAVRWPTVLAMGPGMVAGTLLGTVLAASLSSRSLSIFFTTLVYLAGLQMMLGVKPAAVRQLPGKLSLFAIGGAIGGVCSLLAAGGAFMTVPFLSYCNVRVHHAIGTAAALGFPIALAGTIGYVANGLGHPGLPAYAVGFVYLPAAVCLIIGGMLCAPLGARTAHRMPVQKLRKLFALFLFALATHMLLSLV